jgi:hypothetical protein
MSTTASRKLQADLHAEQLQSCHPGRDRVRRQRRQHATDSYAV